MGLQITPERVSTLAWLVREEEEVPLRTAAGRRGGLVAAEPGRDEADRRGSLSSLLILPTALHADEAGSRARECKGFVIVARMNPEPE